MKTKMKKTILASAVALMTVTNANAVELQLTEQQISAMGVQVAEVKTVSQIPSAWLNGEAIFALNKDYHQTASIAGQIVEVKRVHGPVQKGEVIAVMQSPELTLMQGDLIASLTELNSAEKTLKRAKQLSQAGASAAKNLQQAQFEVDRLTAQIAQQKQSLQITGFQGIDDLIKTRRIQPSLVEFKAPADGEMYDINISKGENIEAYQSIFSMGEVDHVTVHIPVPLKIAAQLEEGGTAEIKVAGEIINAPVMHIERTVDDMTQTRDVHIHLSVHNEQVLPGQRVQVRFMLTPKQTVLQVPVKSLTQFDGENAVFAANDAQVTPQAITVLATSDGRAFIKTDSQSITHVVSAGTTAIKLALSADEE